MPVVLIVLASSSLSSTQSHAAFGLNSWRKLKWFIRVLYKYCAKWRFFYMLNYFNILTNYDSQYRPKVMWNNMPSRKKITTFRK